MRLRNRIAAYSSERIAELAEELAPAVSSSLEKRVADYSEEGIEAPFAVSVEEGASYYKALPKVESTLLAEMRRMSPAAFEVFCKMILLKLNADAVVEGGPYDGGVDFYAIGLSWGKLVDPAPPSSKAVVMGQSKRYTSANDVGEVEVRSFVGGTIKRLDELRRNHPKRFGLLTPVLLAFWTTGDFSVSAKRYAQELGLWYLNGIGLAQLATRLGLSINDVVASEIEAQPI